MNDATPTMLSLQQYQDHFAAALMTDDLSANAAGPLAALIAQPGFNVHRNTVVKGCVDALQANYPAVARLVGDGWFRAAAAAYARAHLPERAMLLDYGARFAEFLARFAPAAALPYLADVARLDRFWTEVHQAPDQLPLSAAEVALLTPPQLASTVLVPHPAARWTWFDEQPIYSIWQRNRFDRDHEQSLDWQAEGALLVRPYTGVESFALGAAACAFLDACAAGATLADAASAALARSAKTDLSSLFAQLLQARAFGRLSRLEPELDVETDR